MVQTTVTWLLTKLFTWFVNLESFFKCIGTITYFRTEWVVLYIYIHLYLYIYLFCLFILFVYLFLTSKVSGRPLSSTPSTKSRLLATQVPRAQISTAIPRANPKKSTTTKPKTTTKKNQTKLSDEELLQLFVNGGRDNSLARNKVIVKHNSIFYI